jgi:ornithine carbamoyltransferase
MNKFKRQGTILRLVKEQQLSTQGDVVQALRDEGLDAVQATVSRDIAQLGLVKVRGESGRLVYALPGAADLDRLGELTAALRRWVVGLEPAGSLVVLRTPPRLCQRRRDRVRRRGAPRDRGLHRRRRHHLRRAARGHHLRGAGRADPPPPGRQHMTLPAALSVDLRGRSLTRIRDWTAAELEAVLDLADELKEKQRDREAHRLLEGRTVGLLFRKHSTRTRVSLEVACAHLGATALYLPGDQLQLARGESVADTARVLSRYLDALAIRTHEHAEVELFAAAGSVPVLNALTDEAHPLQALADLQTIRERFGGLEGVKVAWVGDGSNVCVSLAEACELLDVEFACASPPGYEPPGIAALADPRDAVRDAHVVVTDVWTSMGQEAERAERLAAFAGWTVDETLLAEADADAIVLHCLPAHPGEEITAELLDGPRSAVWDEAENRLHTAKAVLALTLL